MAKPFVLPGWLVNSWLGSLIIGFAAYLAGAADEKQREQKRAQQAEQQADTVVKNERSKAETADHAALQKGTDKWSR